MKIIYPEQLKKNLIKKLYSFYIFLGEDILLVKNTQNLIIQFANKKGFKDIITIDIEKNEDYKKIITFYKQNYLFCKKIILIINLIVKNVNLTLIHDITKTSFKVNLDIIVILKLNHLSISIKKNNLLNQFQSYANIVSCFTPYNLYFTNWIKYEIHEKKIKIEDEAFFFLHHHYEGHTVFAYKILEILAITFPNQLITKLEIKKIITEFSIFSALHWINSIFKNQKNRALYILSVFYKQEYNFLILVRSIQKDLLILIYMKRKKNLNVNLFLQQKKVSNVRHKILQCAVNRIHYKTFFQAIKILVEIEIQIKKKYNYSIWIQLRKLTLILC